MQDNPMPPIPENARPALAWVSWLLFLGLPAAGGFVASMDGCKLKTALIALLGVLGSVAAAIKSGLARPGGPKAPPPAAVLAIGLLVLAPACAPGTYQQGLQYTAYLAAARDAGAAELLTRATATHKRCLAQHRANGVAYEACSRQEYQAVAGWLAAGRILCRTDGPLQGLLVEMRAAGAGK
jgi:hypothetical protein